MQVNFSPYGQPGDLWVRSKGRISLNFNYKINFEDFCTKLCVCSHNNVINISNGFIIVSPGSCPRGGTLGGGYQKLDCGDLRWRPIDCTFWLKYAYEAKYAYCTGSYKKSISIEASR